MTDHADNVEIASGAWDGLVAYAGYAPGMPIAVGAVGAGALAWIVLARVKCATAWRRDPMGALRDFCLPVDAAARETALKHLQAARHRQD